MSAFLSRADVLLTPICRHTAFGYRIWMIQRRVILEILAFVLLVVDGLWFYKHFVAPNAMITYVGLDSTGLTVPMTMRASRLRSGKWDSDPLHALRSVRIDFGLGVRQPSFALVSLDPEGSYGKAVEVIRDLKARHICNVLIREGGQAEGVVIDFPNGPDQALTIPAIVLCGSPVGDAGFFGTLPADGPIHTG